MAEKHPPQQIAERAAEAMWQQDKASKYAGLELKSVAPGTAVMHLKVAQHHANGLGICHGGFIFLLADSTFAFACNSYNRATLAQQADINFIAPGKLGDTLIATASETSRKGRSGIYDVRVTNQDGEDIALFRGLSRETKGQLFNQEA